MAPCNMRCNTCGDYIAKGKKFNARKETVEEETYLGLKVFRFYFKCPRCMAEITFKTDPRNMDYEVEHGATPNFKALKLAEQQAEQEAKEKEEEEKLNPMKLLENRTKASRREMEALEDLEDLREINQRQISINYEEILASKQKEQEELLEKQEKEDEEFVKSVFPSTKDGRIMKVLPDSDSDDDDPSNNLPKLSVKFAAQRPVTDMLTESENKLTTKRKLDGLIKIRKKTKEETHVEKPSKSSTQVSSILLCNYSDSENEDEN